MKSPMVQNLDYVENKDNYSDLQICLSSAGYYIGTVYIQYSKEGRPLYSEPGTRDSHQYFTSRQKAEEFLKDLETMSETEAAKVLRSKP